MKYVLIALLALAIAAPAFAQVPPDIPLDKGWGFGVSTAIPVLKIRESTDEGVKLDVVPVVGFGGGPCVYWGKADVTDIKRIVSLTPMIILSARIDGAEALDVAFGPVFGFFDDFVQLGVVYNGGKIEPERSRWEGLMTIGINFK